MSSGRRATSAFSKTILRSIRASLGRFLAIVGIVALGCGFYAGLQMSGPDMRADADALYDGTNLYDIRLVSTMGFSDKDVGRVEQVAGVDGVMAAISADVMARMGSEQLAVRVSSLDVDAADEGAEQGASAILSDDGNYLNRVFLREGRWPEAADECVITADKAVAGVGVGDTVEALYGTTNLNDVLRERTFRVVGTVSSPNYPYTGSFGSTTLGSGIVGDYLYVAPAAFVEDAPFTEMYLRVQGADAYESGSDAYQAVVDVVRKRLEGRAGRLAQARLDDVRADVQKELDEGTAKLERERSDADAELAAAKRELDEAKRELDEGQVSYDDGLEEYESGKDQAQEQLDEAQHTLDDKRDELRRGRAELAAGEREAADGERTLLDELAAQGIQASGLSSAKRQLEQANDVLSATEATLDALEASQDQVRRLEASVSRYEQLISSLADSMGSTTAQEERLERLRERLASAQEVAQDLADQAESEDASEYLRLVAREANERVADLEDQISQAEESVEQARAYRELLDQAGADLDASRRDMAELRNKVAELPTREELAVRRAELGKALDTVAQLEDAKAQLETARQRLDDGETQLETAQAELDAKRTSADAELKAGKRKLDKAKQQLDEGKAAYEDGLRQYRAGKAEAKRQLDEAQRQLDEAQEKLDELEVPTIYALDRTQSEGALTYDADSRRIDSIADVFPLIFFLVAALVALTTMTRMVDDDRIEIGTYKALGYSTAQIASKYLVYAGAASVTGAVLGVLVLSQLLPFVIMSAYSIIYTVPLHGFPLPLHLGIALASGGLGVGVTLLATWAAVVASLRETPATLMLPRAPAAGKRILLERIGPVWRHLSFSWKVTCRNLFRYKRRLAMTVIGISGCTALLLVGFGLHDAIWDIIDGQYGPIIHYDTTVGLNDDATERDIVDACDFLASAGATDIVRVQQENMRAGLSANEETIRVQVIIPQVPDDIGRAVTFRERVSGRAVSFDEDAVLVTEKLAMKYGLAPGDELLLFDQDAIGNVTGKGHGLRVTGVVENYVGNLVYVGRNAWRKVDNVEPRYATVYAVSDPDPNRRTQLSEALHARDDVSTVIFSDESINLYRNMLSVVDMVVVLLIVSAGLLAFIVLYNLTNINIGERVREIASLKVLGFTRTEVYAYIFREIALLAVLGDALGMVLGTLLATFVITTAEVDYVMFGRSIHPPSYAYAFALTLVFTGLILLVMRHKLDRINMVESLKSVE